MIIKRWYGRSPASPRELCEVCSDINFDQFASLTTASQSVSADTSLAQISLFDVIEHHQNDNCEFCSLLFDTLALEENDPFKNQAIDLKDIQYKTLEAWAKGARGAKGNSWRDKIWNTPHPFGKSRNKVELTYDTSDPDVPLKEVRRQDLEAAEQAGVITSAAAAGAATQAATQEQNRDRKTILSVLGNSGLAFTKAVAIMQTVLPAVVAVTMHNIADPERGLLKIVLMGYGNKGAQASLSILSEFKLRVGSDYQDDGLGLCYGKVISAKVNVKQFRRYVQGCQR
ncbi:Heterokaryon incompatibility protein [Apiospora arundinis]